MKDEQSSSSMDESSDDLGTQPRQEQAQDFQKLVGFQAQTRLDRVLIEGIFGANIMKGGVNDGNARL